MTVTDTPSKRNKQVRIEKPTEATVSGKTTTTWALWARAFVSIAPLSSREHREQSMQSSSVTHVVTGLWSDFEKVTADFRIVWDDRTFHLLEQPRNLEEADVVYEMAVEEETR